MFDISNLKIELKGRIKEAMPLFILSKSLCQKRLVFYQVLRFYSYDIDDSKKQVQNEKCVYLLRGLLVLPKDI